MLVESFLRKPKPAITTCIPKELCNHTSSFFQGELLRSCSGEKCR